MSAIPIEKVSPSGLVHNRSPADDEALYDAANPADPLHDFYWPAALLILGCLELVVWVIHQGRWETIHAFDVSLIAVAVIMAKVAIVSGVVWLFVRRTIGDLGKPKATVLKIAALVVFLDAVVVWLIVGMHATGMISPSGSGAWSREAIELVLMVLIFAALVVTRFLYNLDSDDAISYGCWIALGNVVMNVVLLVAVTAGLHFLLTARMQPTPTSSTNLPVNAHSHAAAPGWTKADLQITREIRSHSPFVIDGRDWEQAHIQKADAQIHHLIDRFYAAGAIKVQVGVVASRAQIMSGQFSHKLYVRLPVEESAKSVCVNIAREYQARNGHAQASQGIVVTPLFLTVVVNG